MRFSQQNEHYLRKLVLCVSISLLPYVRTCTQQCDEFILEVDTGWETLVSELTRSNIILLKPLTPELNPSAQRCLTRFFTGDVFLEQCISLIYA
jgi:hypothetical protein